MKYLLALSLGAFIGLTLLARPRYVLVRGERIYTGKNRQLKDEKLKLDAYDGRRD